MRFGRCSIECRFYWADVIKQLGCGTVCSRGWRCRFPWLLSLDVRLYCSCMRWFGLLLDGLRCVDFVAVRRRRTLPRSIKMRVADGTWATILPRSSCITIDGRTVAGCVATVVVCNDCWADCGRNPATLVVRNIWRLYRGKRHCATPRTHPRPLS